MVNIEKKVLLKSLRKAAIPSRVVATSRLQTATYIAGPGPVYQKRACFYRHVETAEGRYGSPGFMTIYLRGRFISGVYMSLTREQVGQR